MRPILFLLLMLGMNSFSDGDHAIKFNGIRPSMEHPQYWEYHGEEVLLLGGSDEDNLFQMDHLEAQLDLLIHSGGNYVRNTMSSRDSGNVWAFGKDVGTGLYDLNQWNIDYWDKFENFLKQTLEREIFVQIEIWATFDFYRDYWALNPFNPKNNVNYSLERTKLPAEVNTHPTMCENPFFWSVPSHQNNMPVLTFQQRFVDKILSHSLKYDHVLYCIDNETSVTSEWGRFWSDYIRKKAKEHQTEIHVTEMWDPWDLNHISHRETFDHPEIYSYVEISQNNHQAGENHWTNGLAQIERLKKTGNLRPVNNVKTYGAYGGRHGGGTHNGIESFLRSALFGSAAVRFHRPPSGLGLSDTAQLVIHGMRSVADRLDYFKAVPANSLLSLRTNNEAYCRAIPGKEYLVYFPFTGAVDLQLVDAVTDYSISRMEILTGVWNDVVPDIRNNHLHLESTGRHTFFLIIKK
jgi:hypothetical protein